MTKTIYKTFLDAAHRFTNNTALMYKKQGRYSEIKYCELVESVETVAANLVGLGVKKGDTVGIFSNNRPEWAIADLACMKLGAVVVPIYQTLPPACVEYVVNDSHTSLIFVENNELFTVVDGIRSEVPDLKTVVIFDSSGIDSRKDFLKFRDLNRVDSRESVPDVAASGDDVATIVYTSGTTGDPKGVVLTNRNIVTNAFATINRFRVIHKDIILSYLPLSHMFERTCGYYVFLFAGGCIAYAENLSTVADDVKEIRPTIILAVPRVVEKAYEKVVTELRRSPYLKQALVTYAIKCLNTYANLSHKKMKISIGLRVKCAIFNAFVSPKFRKLGGGRLRIIATGGAPLNRKIAKAFYIFGLNIVEGYGLTETAPIVCCNSVKDNRLGTVGKPLEEIEVKIGDGDEILIRGPNVMKEYFSKPEDTKKVIESNGWFHTGDRGRFDESGHLIITGRIKEILVSSYGKKIPSAPIEAQIAGSEYISQVVLCGDNRKCVGALVVPNREQIQKHAKEGSIHSNSYSDLLETDGIKALIKGVIEKSTEDLPSYEQIKVFTVIPEEFTVTNGMLTPTIKLRRNKILEKYRKEIDAMYAPSE